jgi:hypothetical protein
LPKELHRQSLFIESQQMNGKNVGETYTKLLFAAKLSTIPLPAKKPRPRGLYGTIPMPSSLNAQVYQDTILILPDEMSKSHTKSKLT